THLAAALPHVTGSDYMVEHCRDPATEIGTASALWNLAYDAGYGAGPAVFGLLVGHTGYPAAFAATGVLILAALPACRRVRRSPGSQTSAASS
ncbi:MAG: MFS transporter, partial [Streptosporangiaceae bacterium]